MQNKCLHPVFLERILVRRLHNTVWQYSLLLILPLRFVSIVVKPWLGQCEEQCEAIFWLALLCCLFEAFCVIVKYCQSTAYYMGKFSNFQAKYVAFQKTDYLILLTLVSFIRKFNPTPLYYYITSIFFFLFNFCSLFYVGTNFLFTNLQIVL